MFTFVIPIFMLMLQKRQTIITLRLTPQQVVKLQHTIDQRHTMKIHIGIMLEADTTPTMTVHMGEYTTGLVLHGIADTR
jgi:hypothetical protein